MWPKWLFRNDQDILLLWKQSNLSLDCSDTSIIINSVSLQYIHLIDHARTVSAAECMKWCEKIMCSWLNGSYSVSHSTSSKLQNCRFHTTKWKKIVQKHVVSLSNTYSNRRRNSTHIDYKHSFAKVSCLTVLYNWPYLFEKKKSTVCSNSTPHSKKRYVVPNILSISNCKSTLIRKSWDPLLLQSHRTFV